MSEKKMSVIVPVYKVEKYIKRCIDSLLNQSFEDYEIIVVNDGTPDDSMVYVKKMQQKTDKIIICNRENGGLSAARNTGIRRAKGEYLLFCDSDDAVSTDCLQRIYKEAKEKELDMLLFDATTVWDMEKAIEEPEQPYVRRGIQEDVISGSDMLRILIDKKKYLASACLYLVKRELLMNNQLRFHEGILHEDELFTPELLLKAQKVEHRNWLVYERHVREGSITRSDNYSERVESLAIVIRELTDFLNKEMIDENEKKVLWNVIESHIKNFLVGLFSVKQISNELKEKKKMINLIVKENHLKLGMEFKIYLFYRYLRKGLGI